MTKLEVVEAVVAEVGKGWCRGHSFGKKLSSGKIVDCVMGRHDCCCVHGAFIVVQVANKIPHGGVVNEALDGFKAFIGENSIWVWNDRPSQTQESVLSNLGRYADFLRTVIG